MLGQKRSVMTKITLFAAAFTAVLWALLGTAVAAISDETATDPLPRLALVIGNSDYQSSMLDDLPNSRNDAEKLSEAFKALHFDVILLKDASLEAITGTLDGVGKRLDQYGAVVFFYAGHGVQINGVNYLLPVDTPDPETAEALISRAIKLDGLINQLATRNRPTLIFLDACRNNPLPKGSEPLSDGLAQVQVGDNTYIAFSTKPGGVTFDGSGDNSPFTKALLQSLPIPGRSVSEMMLQVRKDTELLTLEKQTPWEQSNLLENFYFTAQQNLAPDVLTSELLQAFQDPATRKLLMDRVRDHESLQSVVLDLSRDRKIRSVDSNATGPQTPDVQLSPPMVGGTDVAMASPSPASQSLDIGSDRAYGAPNPSLVEILRTIMNGDRHAGKPEEDTAKLELARQVQTELRRLGCYRSKIDGDWRKASIGALSEYNRRTGQKAGDTEPNVDLLQNLYLRSGRICPEPPVVLRKPATQTAKADDPIMTGKAGGKSDGAKAIAPRKPVAPPPDISGAIGIGGIF